MLTQWHLLMEQLQQSEIEKEDLAGSTGDVDKQNDTSRTTSPHSVTTLRALHNQLGNQGFRQWLQQQQVDASTRLGSDMEEEQTVNAVETDKAAQQQEVPKEAESINKETTKNLDVQRQGMPKEQDKKEALKSPKSTKKEPSVNDMQPPPLTAKKEAHSSYDFLPLLNAFSNTLPTPSAKLWQRLEQYYLSRTTKQQTRIVHALVKQVQRLPAPQKTLFFEGIEHVSHWHVVQAVLNKVAPQTAVDTIPEPPQPAPPDED